MLRWRNWNACWIALAFAILSLAPSANLLSPAPALAETPSLVRIPREALREQAAIEAVLRDGARFEQAGRWRDAVRAYEEGVRKYGDELLRERLAVARMHFDVERRYQDPSFLRTLDATTDRLALNVLAEVLLKIDTYHVEEPHWRQLAARGIDSFRIALANPDFQQRFFARQQRVAPAMVSDEASRLLADARIATRHDLYAFVGELSDLLQRRWNLPASTVSYEFVCASLQSLDWYSAFLTADQYNEVISQIDGNFVGLGVELRPQEDRLEIVQVLANGPAGEAGLHAGDAIVAIDSEWVSKLGGEVAADRLRGPEGSQVELVVERATGVRRMLRIHRRLVEVPSLTEVRMLDAARGVGYIAIDSFQRTTVDEFQDALWRLHREGLRSLIVDVRGNPGGLLDASVDLANMFVAQGKLVSTKGRNPGEDRVHTARYEGTWQVPLIVLVDGDSASAAEIFAGAIRDHQRGTLIGTRTYGKGSVQGIFPLNSDGGGIRLTTAKFYSPQGRAISERGVEPDVEVHTQLRPNYDDPESSSATAEQDHVLDVALDHARRMPQARRP